MAKKKIPEMIGTAYATAVLAVERQRRKRKLTPLGLPPGNAGINTLALWIAGEPGREVDAIIRLHRAGFPLTKIRRAALTLGIRT
ncbi:MAG: hypothetical protein A2W19_01375 [Spirochaetes bacterium RBG_16_49_21]|nr:MAG: hypothetical protein A2W19_01375 [Spirochaetes bacterium RBG_16_49_21]